MKICQDCLQFKNRATNWNNTHGVTTDPVPYISEIVKGHKHLIFEERRVDGAGWIGGVFRCGKCKQWWELLSWPAMGQLDVRSYTPEYHSPL